MLFSNETQAVPAYIYCSLGASSVTLCVVKPVYDGTPQSNVVFLQIHTHGHTDTQGDRYASSCSRPVFPRYSGQSPVCQGPMSSRDARDMHSKNTARSPAHIYVYCSQRILEYSLCALEEWTDSGVVCRSPAFLEATPRSTACAVDGINGSSLRCLIYLEVVAPQG